MSEDTDTVTTNPADESLENDDAADAEAPAGDDEANIEVSQSAQDEETANESAPVDQTPLTTTTKEDTSEVNESLSPQADNTVSVVFWGTNAGKVVKTIEADASGKYIIKAGDAPAAPATCTFNFSNDLGINFSVTGTFEGWKFRDDIYSADQIESLPAVGKGTAIMSIGGYSNDNGAIAYSSLYPQPFETFGVDTVLQDNYQFANLAADNVVVLNPVYKIADEDIAHISFYVESFETGEGDVVGSFTYCTPQGYVFNDAQINKIIENARMALGASKAAGYSGIYKDDNCNQVTQLKDPITVTPVPAMYGVAPDAMRTIAFYLNNRSLTGENTQAVQGLANARADVFNVMRPDGATVVVQASKVSPTDQQYADFHSAVQVEGIDDIFDISLLIDGVDTKDNFNELKLQLPVDPKYNGHTLRIHHFHAVGDVDTFECIAQNGFILFSVNKLSLFGIEDLGVASVYTEPTADSGNSGNNGNAGSSNGSSATGSNAQRPANNNPAQPAQTTQASVQTQPDVQASASTLPATGDDVSGVPFALTALVAAAVACFAAFSLRTRKHGNHAR